MSTQTHGVKVPYRIRWGHERTRVIKGHPKREARRQRAYARGGSRPAAKPTIPAGAQVSA